MQILKLEDLENSQHLLPPMMSSHLLHPKIKTILIFNNSKTKKLKKGN